MDTYAKELIEMTFEDIKRKLKGARIYGIEIDTNNIAHTTVAAYWYNNLLMIRASDEEIKKGGQNK